jgi:hypothetical protein
MEGYFDYMQFYLAPPVKRVPVKLMTTSNTEPDHYPVTVYDVNGKVLGNAANKATYITIWNSNPSNAAIGKLTGGYGPFSFVLYVKPGTTIPASVTGEPVHLFAGIFTNAFSSEFN